MVCVIGEGEIAGEINPHAMTVADRDGWQNVQEFVEDAPRGLAHAFAHSLLNALGARLS